MLAAYMLELTDNTNVTIQRLMCVSCVQYIAINILLQHFDLGNSVQRDGTVRYSVASILHLISCKLCLVSRLIVDNLLTPRDCVAVRNSVRQTQGMKLTRRRVTVITVRLAQAWDLPFE